MDKKLTKKEEALLRTKMTKVIFDANADAEKLSDPVLKDRAGILGRLMGEVLNGKIQDRILFLEGLGIDRTIMKLVRAQWGCPVKGTVIADFDEQREKRIGVAIGSGWVTFLTPRRTGPSKWSENDRICHLQSVELGTPEDVETVLLSLPDFPIKWLDGMLDPNI